MAKYNLPATIENGRDLGDACEATCEIEVEKGDEGSEAVFVKVQYDEGAPDEERGYLLVGADVGFAGLALGQSNAEGNGPASVSMRLPYPVAIEVLEKALTILKAHAPKEAA
jgi:hypothetical protein